MPYWPAWVLGALGLACAVPALTAPSPASEEVKCATAPGVGHAGTPRAALPRCRAEAR